MSHSSQPHGLQHARLPHSLLTLGVCSDSFPLSQWRYLTTSSSASPFFCLQSFLASGSFPMSWLFASGSQSISIFKKNLRHVICNKSICSKRPQHHKKWKFYVKREKSSSWQENMTFWGGGGERSFIPQFAKLQSEFSLKRNFQILLFVPCGQDSAFTQCTQFPMLSVHFYFLNSACISCMLPDLLYKRWVALLKTCKIKISNPTIPSYTLWSTEQTC